MSMLTLRLSVHLFVTIFFLRTPKGLTQKSFQNSRSGAAIEHRQLQASLLPVLTQFAQDLNEKFYNGAVATKDIINRIDAAELENPNGILAKVKESLGKASNPGGTTQKTAPVPVDTSETVQDADPGISARNQLAEMMRQQKQRSSEESSGLEGGSEPVNFNDLMSGENTEQVVTHINLKPLRKANSLIGAGLGGLLKTIGRNRRPDQVIYDSEGQSPGAYESNLSESETKNTEFQGRMTRLAELLRSEEPTADSFSAAPASEIAHTLGPPSGENTAEHHTIREPEAKEVPKDNGCWLEDTALEGEEFRVKEGLQDLSACRDYCESLKDCLFFSFAPSPTRCYMFEKPASLRSSEGVVSGPVKCSLLSDSGAIPPFWPRSSRRRLLEVSNDDGSKPQSGCLAGDTNIQGNRIGSRAGIESVSACQKICLSSQQCEFFSYAEELKQCYMYDQASGVADAKHVISGPRTCLESVTRRSAQESTRSAATGRLVAPTTLPLGIDNSASVQPEGHEKHEYIGGQQANTQKSIGARGNKDGLLGSVLGGGRTRTGNGGLLSGGGILSGLLGQGNGGEREIEGMASGVESMFSTLQAMMAAGDTVMKTFPIADMVRTGYQLANSGLLDGAKGGGGKGTGATAPPTGGRCVSVPPKSKSCVSVGNPEVTCLSEGMRCCVPRIASPKYQVDPPNLNGVDSSRCVATYVSQWDQLCATVKYDDDECGTFVLETSNMFVYRNVMEMPGKNMNNAICECSIQKSGGDTQSSGKWEYSLVAKEEEEVTKQKDKETLGKLTNAAKVAVTWMDALSPKNGQTGAAGGGSANSFLNSLINLAEDVGVQGNPQSTAKNKPLKNADASGDANVNAAADALMGALNQILSKAGNGEQKGRRLQDKEATIPVPLNCSVWRKDCEKSLERLMFDGTCHSVSVVREGCPREDVEVTLESKAANPTYRFRLPSVFGLQPLGVVCDFVFAPLPKDGNPQPSVCPEGSSFPIPDQNLPDNWPSIRERGPVLELLLALAPENTVISSAAVAALLLQTALNSDQSIPNPVPIFAASDSELFPNLESTNIRGFDSELEVTSRRRLTEGTVVLLSLEPTLTARQGESMSALFDVGEKLDHKPRWGKESKREVAAWQRIEQ